MTLIFDFLISILNLFTFVAKWTQVVNWWNFPSGS